MSTNTKVYVSLLSLLIFLVAVLSLRYREILGANPVVLICVLTTVNLFACWQDRSLKR